MEWMLLPLKRYAEFSGRSRRKEYWMFVLFTIIVGLVLGVIDTALGLTFGGSETSSTFGSGNGVLGGIFSLATFVPSLAVGVRRLHDTDRTGWWLLLPVLIGFAAVFLALFMIDGISGSAGFAGLGIGMGLAIVAAVIGGFVLLVFLCLDGTRGPNRFGADPKGGDLADVFA